MTKEHDNKFTLKMVGMTDMDFKIDDYKIHSGQPWDGIKSISTNNGEAVINVRAGRKGSEEVADWFKQQVGGGSAIGCSSHDRLPGKLNFAFVGTMTFKHGGSNFTAKKVIIGQGHSSADRNNWWIGGEGFEGISAGYLGGGIAETCQKNGLPLGKVGFATVMGDISSVDMGLISV